jgi:hypothetical protein
MPIKFDDVESAIDATPYKRFPDSTVTATAVFKWHRLARPQPRYSLCVAKIIAVQDPDLITVRLFDEHGVLHPEQLEVNLADWNQAWRTSPSTLDPAFTSHAELNGKDCAVVCLSDALLDKYYPAPRPAVEFAKFPYTEEAIVNLTIENANLRAALLALKSKVSPHDFDEALLHNHVDANWI